MAIWQWGLLALFGVWALQSLGVWLQMRHYTDVFKGVTNQFNDGFVGAGNFRGRLSKGTIVVVVVTPDLIVRRLLIMSGRTVFTKFRRHRRVRGDDPRSAPVQSRSSGRGGPGVAEAVKRAIEQIDRAAVGAREAAGFVRLERSSRIAQPLADRDKEARRLKEEKCQSLQCWHSMPTWPSNTCMWQARWSRMLLFITARSGSITRVTISSCLRRRHRPRSCGDGITVEEFKDKLQNVTQEEQLGWLTAAGKYFIGIFQEGGKVFAGFVTGIIPTLVVLMTAFYAITELVGEERVHGIARGAGKIALTRYTVLPVISVFFLTNPMAYTFGSFLEEKHKPAFYDAAVSYVHPPLGLFPHINPGEYFVWGGVLVALLELESKGAVASGYHIRVAIWYAIVGLIVILLKGMLTERITAIMARRQGVEL